MGYWGYEATESDSALDYLNKVTTHLEKLWDDASDYGEKMAVVYVLSSAPEIDGTDHHGLKAKMITYLSDYADLLDEDGTEFVTNEIKYLRGLVATLQEEQGSTLIPKLTV